MGFSGFGSVARICVDDVSALGGYGMKSNQPKYMQLKQEILRWLKEGKLKPDEKLPTEYELAEMFSISRHTVRQAIGEMVHEGYLYRVQGSGTFVKGQKGREEGEKTIGLVTTYISDYIFPSIIRGAEAYLRNKGYRLPLSSTDNDKDKERESLERMAEYRLSGLIIEPTKSAEPNRNLDHYLSLEFQGIPYLMINAKYPELDCASVRIDDEKGAFLATEHLIRLGHRHIAGFFKTDDLQGVERMKGYFRAHKQYGIPVLPELVVRYTTEQKWTFPREAAVRLLAAENAPTALFCYNDELAVHLLDVIREQGKKIPQDLSMASFDDSSLATATETKLTTIVHPKAKLGEKAAQILLEMIEGKWEGRAPTIVFEPELIVRDSTGEPRL